MRYLRLERNDRIFNDKNTNAFSLALRIHYYILLWTSMNAHIQDKLPSTVHQDIRKKLELRIQGEEGDQGQEETLEHEGDACFRENRGKWRGGF